MKKSILLSIIFILGIHGMHAGTPEYMSKKTSGNTIEITINLAQVAPQVFSSADAIHIQINKDLNTATIYDIPFSALTDFENQEFMESVKPVTPAEADFNDAAPEPVFNINKYAPVTPKEATFDDEIPAASPKTDPLAPVTPKYASFDD